MPLLSPNQKKLITVNEPDIQGVCPNLFQKAIDESTGRVLVKIGLLYFVEPGFSNVHMKPRSLTEPFPLHNLVVGDYT
jgi:hypothetical protein